MLGEMDGYGNSVEFKPSNFFVGRKKELKELENKFNSQNTNMEIISIYGPEGIGKTSLLQAFGRMTEQSDGIFLLLDSTDFIHSPRNFIQKLMCLLDSKINQSLSLEPSFFKTCMQTLSRYSSKHRIVFANTYEQMGDLDRWFREMFVRQIPQNILIILSGRFPLAGEWSHSPAWRELVHEIQLCEFTFDQTVNFLKNFNIRDKKYIQNLWLLTAGHPLTLSLALDTFRREKPC